MARFFRAVAGLPFREVLSRAVWGRADNGGLTPKVGTGDAGSLTKREPFLSKSEWQKKLTPEQFHVTREKGTEPPFSGTYLNNKEAGMYHCVCCDSPLFRGGVGPWDGQPAFSQESYCKSVKGSLAPMVTRCSFHLWTGKAEDVSMFNILVFVFGLHWCSSFCTCEDDTFFQPSAQHPASPRRLSREMSCICPIHSGGQRSHVAVGYSRCGWCGWKTELLILFNFN